MFQRIFQRSENSSLLSYIFIKINKNLRSLSLLTILILFLERETLGHTLKQCSRLTPGTALEDHFKAVLRRLIWDARNGTQVGHVKGWPITLPLQHTY